MKFITYRQYIEYLKNEKILQLMETSVDYEFEKQEEKYDEKRAKEIDKKHDKMIKNILSDKIEVTKFLNKFLQLEKIITEKEIIQCSTDFITKNYKEKHSDLIYKLKDEPVYFMIEHQSTIDSKMLIRIWEYVGEIIRKESIIHQTYLSEENIYPIIVPIVIYTGYRKWNVKTNFSKMQYQSSFYEKYKFSLEYNLVSVQDYTFEEFFELDSLFGMVMVIEKCKTKKEIETRMNQIVKKVKNNKKKEKIEEIINYIIAPIIGRQKTEKMLEKLYEKEEIKMSPFTKAIFDAEIEARERGLKEGKEKLP